CDRLAPDFAHLLGQDARENVGVAAWRKWSDDTDRLARKWVCLRESWQRRGPRDARACEGCERQLPEGTCAEGRTTDVCHVLPPRSVQIMAVSIYTCAGESSPEGQRQETRENRNQKR